MPGLKDKMWWYCSARDQNIKTQVPNFPVKAFETGLRNLTGKVTYALSQNNKLTGYAMGGEKLQPNRLDRFLVAATVARHSSEESTLEPALLGPHLQGRLRVGDQRQVVPRDSWWPVQVRVAELPLERVAGLRGHRQPASSRGANRDGWFNIPSRNQVAGSMTYYKDGWMGSHNFKVGGEWFRETFTYDAR